MQHQKDSCKPVLYIDARFLKVKFTSVILSTETTEHLKPVCYENYYKILSTVAALNVLFIFPEDDIFVSKHVAVGPVLLYVYNIVHFVCCHK
jgi:hypothetical protein